MDDLVQWLRAMLDDDEQIARRATARQPGGESWVYGSEGVRASSGLGVATRAVPVHGEHIARHDPARVLREIEAKRRILNEIVPRMNQMDDQLEAEFGTPSNPDPYESENLLRLLALPYADRPNYREEWAP